MKTILKLAIVGLIFFNLSNAMAQDNVGIGTLTPNQNAILDLTSTNKGVLLPRMTTTERLAISPLGAAENGLIVYDTDSSLFYFWDGSQWNFFPAPLSDGDWIVDGSNVYSAANRNVGIGVVSPQAKLHTNGTLRFQGLSNGTHNDVLVVSSNGDVRKRNLGSDIWDGDDVIDNDSDPTNECNTAMFFDSNTQELTIADGACGTVSTIITIGADDMDKDATNEIQDLTSFSSGTNVTVNISDGGNSTTFSIDDGDSNPSNEFQSLSVNQVGDSINWSLSDGGGSGAFGLDDGDWTGEGTGSMYPVNLSDKIGIGTSTPAFDLDVKGDIRANDRLYLSTTDYYLENNGSDLRLFSANNMRFETNNDHLLRLYESGSEAIMNVGLDGNDVLTARGSGSVGIGTTDPANTLQVAGDVRVGLVNPPGFANGGNNYGDLLYFSGGPGFSGGIDSDNGDLLFISRYNIGTNTSELRIAVGDDYNVPGSNDRLSIGSYNSGDLNTYQGLFQFDINNPGNTLAPMLSISPFGTTHQKSYHGGLAITKPSGSNGQYINLARGSASTVWSLGYQYGTTRFAISEGNTNDAAFATTPAFTILSGSGYVGLGVAAPSYRLELPNEASTNGRGRAEMWVTYSDGRFKKNRNSIGTVIPKVMKMNPLTYQWEKYDHDEEGNLRALGETKPGREYGFIAQDLYKLFPEIVMKPEDESKDTWSVAYQRLTVILTKAIQEQQQMLEQERADHDQTKAELEQMKSEIQELKDRMDAIAPKANVSDGQTMK